MTSWKPRGPLVDTRKALTADAVEAVGIGGNPKVLVENWKRYVSDKPNHSPDITLAFVRACSLMSVRAPDFTEPVIQELSEFTALTDDCYRDLAAVASQLGDAKTCKTLFTRSLGIKRVQGFYLSLIHLAAETLKEPDMTFAIKVCDEMETHTIQMCFPQLKMMLHGFAREKRPNVRTVLNIVQYAQDMSNGVPNICFLQKAIGILESFSGEDAILVNAFMQQTIGAELMDRMVDGVIPATFNGEDARHDGDKITYYMIDPFCTDVDKKLKLAPNTYLVFLYSTLRHLCEKCITCGVNHPLRRKAALIRDFLDENSQSAVVFPWEHEIMLHSDPAVVGDLHNTPHSKMLVFMKRITQTASNDCKLVFVTKDRLLASQVEKIDCVDVVTEFPKEMLA